MIGSFIRSSGGLLNKLPESAFNLPIRKFESYMKNDLINNACCTMTINDKGVALPHDNWQS